MCIVRTYLNINFLLLLTLNIRTNSFFSTTNDSLNYAHYMTQYAVATPRKYAAAFICG